MAASSTCHRAVRSAPGWGLTLSGRPAAHARASQARRNAGPGDSPGCAAAPFSFVGVDVPGDLRGPRAEDAHEIRQLPDLPIGSQVIPMSGERGPEVRVTGDRGVPDTVDRREEIADTDGVQAAPF